MSNAVFKMVAVLTLLGVVGTLGWVSAFAAEVEEGAWSILGSGGPPRHTYASAYDSSRGRWVLFGGSDGQSFRNETYVLSLAEGTWTQVVSAGPNPSSRRLVEGVYDPVGDRFVIFGGIGHEGFLGDVWTLRLSESPQWSEVILPEPGPSPRAGHSLVYDPDGHRIIVFGGFDPTSPTSSRRNDVWSLSLVGRPHWIRLRPSGASPSPRSSHGAVYDTARRRMIVFGGSDGSFRNDVWALSLVGRPAWERLVGVNGSPAPREEHVAVLDPLRRRLLVQGGYGDELGTPLGDLWSLSLEGEASWTRLSPSGGPLPRWGHGAVYESSSDRVVIHGGQFGLAETWALGLGPAPPSAPGD